MSLCATHEDALAGWRCDACKKSLCGKCTAGSLGRFYCSACGEPATQLTVARVERPYTTWLAKALLYPFGRGAIVIAVTAIAIGLAAYTLGRMPGFAHLTLPITAALAGIALIVVVDIAAHGGTVEDGAPIRWLRALASTSLVTVPVAAYLVLVPEARADALLYLPAGLAAIYVPLALVVAVTDVGFGDVVRPARIFELGGQIVRPYLRTIVAAVVLGGILGAMALPGGDALREAVGYPLVADIAGAFPLAIAVAVVGYVLGALPHVHGASWGWRAPDSYRDPLLPHLVAEGPRKLVAPAAGPKAASPETIADPKERNDARAIVALLKQEDPTAALKLYRTRPVWTPTAFEDRELIKLARIAQRSDKPMAIRLLEAAVARNGRSAADALVALAQLADDARATDLLRRVVAEHPKSDAARLAKQKLAA